MKTILLCVDMQKGFIHDEAMEALSQRISGLLDKDKKLFDVVILTHFNNNPGSPFEHILDWKGMQAESELETAVELKEALKDSLIIKKNTYAPQSAELIKMLTEKNDGVKPDTVCIAGADTDCCILATAIVLFEAGIRPVVLEEYCYSGGGIKSHMAGILCMGRLIGKEQICERVINSREDLEIHDTR